MQSFIVAAEILIGLALIGGLFTFPAAGFSLILQAMFVTTTDADIRRGELSLQKKFGRRTSVICGDYLVCMAMKIAVSAAEESEQEDNMKFQMPDYMSRVCLGELYQHINNGNVDLSVRQYLRIVSGKTAALFEASFYAGAAFIEDDIRIVKKYAKLGRYVGMIFQLTDDCMDFEESEETAKKPVQSDYEQNVITDLCV